MELDLREDLPDGVYRTVTSAVTPRPIGWISTRSSDGVDNLAPFSFFNALSSRPPVLVFSAGRREGRPKDSANNAVETGEFVYNLVTEDVLEAMDATADGYPPEESEFDAVGIERAPSVAVDPPRVAEAHCSFECELYETMDVHGQTVVFGEVVYVHADESILTDGKLDTRKIDAVGRLGGPFYSGVDLLDYRRQY